MRCFIASLLSDEVKKYHSQLCESLSRQFGPADPCQKIPSHFTLKSPFESDQDQTKRIETLLASFARRQKPAPLKVANFGHFGDRVVYLRIVPSDAAREIYRALVVTLGKISWLTWNNHDGNQGPGSVLPNRGSAISPKANREQFHATLARPRTPRQFREIWRYLSGLKYSARMSFDNIAILYHTGDKWEIYRRFDF